MLWLIRQTVSNIISGVVSVFTKKQETSLERYKVNGQVSADLIKAEAERIKAVKELNLASLAYAGDRWMRYMFAYPLGIWWLAVIVDSVGRKMFEYEWTYRVLTAPIIELWGGYIVGYLFIHTTITTSIDKFMRRG